MREGVFTGIYRCLSGYGSVEISCFHKIWEDIQCMAEMFEMTHLVLTCS